MMMMSIGVRPLGCLYVCVQNDKHERKQVRGRGSSGVGCVEATPAVDQLTPRSVRWSRR